MSFINDTISATIRKNAGVQSNWEYRQFMQNNGRQIMRIDTQEYFNASGNNPYYSTGSVQATPFMFQHGFDSRRPALVGHDSDLKRDFIHKRQLASRMVAPTMFVQNERKI